MFMIMGGQLDGLLSHWQPAFANKLIDWLTEKEREPVDSFSDGSAGLWQYDDRKRQLDLFCVTWVHISVSYAGAKIQIWHFCLL